jgi:hypothetical protein
MSDAGAAGKNRDWGRRAFGPARRRGIAAFAEALFSDENDEGLTPAPATLVERVTDEFDLLIGAGSIDLRRGFNVLAFLVEWLPIVVLGELSRASRLPLARRLAYLHRLEHARIALLATLFVGFKLPLTMIAFELGAELRSTGFDRATISTPRQPRKLAVEESPAGPGALSRAAGQGGG